MKKLFTLFLILFSSHTFAQGNFTIEWESPAGWRIANSQFNPEGIVKLISNSNIYHLAFEEVNNSNNVRFYNGSTHSLDYSWSWSGGTGFDVSGISGINYGEQFSTSNFDVNGDGVNEIFQNAVDNRIVNPVNGDVLYSSNDWFNYIIDIDGDGYLDIIERVSPSPYRLRIISTPAQTVSI